MLISLAFKRMRQEWRILAILLLAISLVTGFLALGPLYIRGVTEVDLRFALDNAPTNDLQITILSNQPLTTEAETIVEEELGGLISDVDRYIRADYTAPVAPTNNAPGQAGIHACTYTYEIGINPLTSPTGNPNCTQASGSAVQPFAFTDLDKKVEVVQGRLPNRTPPPEEVSGEGFSDAEQEALELGFYQRGQVEAVITATVAEEAELEVGSIFYVGQFFLDGTGSLSSVKIVGIVEPSNPDDAFWRGNNMFTDGVSNCLDSLCINERYDFGLAVDTGSYQDWIASVVPGNNYIWEMDTDPSVVNTTNSQEVLDGLTNIRNRLGQTDPAIQVFSGYSNLLVGYSSRVSDAEGPITFLSGAVLVLLLYHLVTTVSLVLQQQSTEWSTITSRGGSTGQLFSMQLITVGILSIIAFGSAFLISRLFMIFMGEFGPLSEVLGDANIADVPMPERSIFLALGGAVTAMIVLSLPSIPAATKSLLLLKQAASRPPTNPTWARLFLDFILVGLGIALLGRLYANSTPSNVTYVELLETLFTDPETVIDSIANNLTENQGLNDPFNLLGPALFLTGIAMLWLRIFPLMVGLVSRFTSRIRTLTTPLAVWSVERDPGHYAQLVLLLIGTLALGTASLGLSATRDVGAWEVAHNETGGTVRVETDPATGTLENVRWERLDGVQEHAFVLHHQATPVREARSNVDIQIIGLDAATFSDAFPEYENQVGALKDAEDLEIPGKLLPEDAQVLQVRVWSTATGDEDFPDVGVELNAYLADATGVLYAVELSRPDIDVNAASGTGDIDDTQTGPPPTPAERWVTLSANLPVSGRAPYSLWRVGVASRQADLTSFSHILYLDFWETIDENGVSTTLEDYEAVTDEWTAALQREPYRIESLSSSPTAGADPALSGVDFEIVNPRQEGIEPVFEGDTSVMKLDYTIRSVLAQISEPSLKINPVVLRPIPTIVSTQFSQAFRGTGRTSVTSRTPDLREGDNRQILMNIGTGTVTLNLSISDIVDKFPTVVGDNPYFVVMPINATRLLFNQAARAPQVFDANQVWLELDERQPSGTLVSQIEDLEGVTSVVYAWDRYGQILREPLPSAIAGMLFAGFWISLALSLLDFAFYIAVTAQQRSFTFGVLRSLGWNANNIWRLLLIEQITMVVPALIIGSLIGAGLAYLILPFLSLVGSVSLRIPMLDLGGLLASLLIGFTILLVVAAQWLRRMSVNQVLRLGEE